MNELEEIEINKIKKKKKVTRVFSDAFPPDILGRKDKQPSYSLVHKKLSEINIDQTKITYRSLTQSDIEEIKLLHKEWFPIEYTEEYFNQILIPENRKKNIFTLAATYTDENIEYILGIIISELNTQEEFINQVPEKFIDKVDISFFEDINILEPDYEFGYIMIIGVVDECRRMKLGTILLNKIKNEFLTRKKCLCVYLHVISYNQTAIDFYIRNNFTHTNTLKNFYRVKNEHYDCEVFVKFFTQKERLLAFKNKKRFFDLVDYLIFNPLKFLLYCVTCGLFCRKCRRKHKLD